MLSVVRWSTLSQHLKVSMSSTLWDTEFTWQGQRLPETSKSLCIKWTYLNGETGQKRKHLAEGPFLWCPTSQRVPWLLGRRPMGCADRWRQTQLPAPRGLSQPLELRAPPLTGLHNGLWAEVVWAEVTTSTWRRPSFQCLVPAYRHNSTKRRRPSHHPRDDGARASLVGAESSRCWGSLGHPLVDYNTRPANTDTL